MTGHFIFVWARKKSLTTHWNKPIANQECNISECWAIFECWVSIYLHPVSMENWAPPLNHCPCHNASWNPCVASYFRGNQMSLAKSVASSFFQVAQTISLFFFLFFPLSFCHTLVFFLCHTLILFHLCSPPFLPHAVNVLHPSLHMKSEVGAWKYPSRIWAFCLASPIAPVRQRQWDWMVGSASNCCPKAMSVRAFYVSDNAMLVLSDPGNCEKRGADLAS